jgi:hypothetical protein
MKRFSAFILLLSLLASLCACGKYISSYSAIGLLRSNTSHSCKASFHKLDGELTFKIKKTDTDGEGDISYTVSADKGEIRLYYDIYGTKEKLAEVKAGESVTSRGGYIESGKDVYIIIEATDAGGKVTVELNNED